MFLKTKKNPNHQNHHVSTSLLLLALKIADDAHQGAINLHQFIFICTELNPHHLLPAHLSNISENNRITQWKWFYAIVLHGKKVEVGFPWQEGQGKEATSSLSNRSFPLAIEGLIQL